MAGSNSIGILGTGGYTLPLVENEPLMRLLGMPRPAAWLSEKTGIEGHSLNFDAATGCKRFPDLSNLDYAEQACRLALKDARIAENEVDHLILSTCTPSQPRFWADAIELHRRLGLGRSAIVHQVDGGCAALANAFKLAQVFAAADGRRITLIAAANDVASFIDVERYGRVADAWFSPVMFADGAGAAVLGPVGAGPTLRDVYCGVDGAHPLVTYRGGGAAVPTRSDTLDEHAYVMNARDVVAQFGPAMMRVWSYFQAHHGLDVRDIGRWYLHQANLRLIEAFGRFAGLPLDRIPTNVERFGNTVSASTLLLLDEDRRLGRLPEEKPFLFMWVGAGMVEGGALFA